MVLAMMATLLMAGSAFAINRNLTPVPNATFSFGAPGIAAGPTTTNNDDSCDIGLAPAATLLLPYFEVDAVNRTTTTLFTITNVSRLPQIAHVTLWTDWSFPVLDFNIFLTGYDVQSINMLDILAVSGGGVVAPPSGTGPATTPGSLSAANNANPNFAPTINCGNLPGALPGTLVAALRTALTTGASTTYCPTSTLIGGIALSGFAHGYVTIDVASNCSTNLPNVANYFLNDILYDNVLIGDYQQLGPAAAGTTASSFDAGGNPMVHIRAVPEGGTAGSTPGSNLPYTFYDRYTATLPAGGNVRLSDRRQPLPSTWAARYIQGGAGNFATNYKIWREGFGIGLCGTVAQNGTLLVSEIVRFDEHEVPFTFGSGQNCSPCINTPVTLPETSATNTASATYPTLASPSGDVGGWMYLNLNNGGSPTSGYSVTRNVAGVFSNPNPSNLGNPRASQNWVVVELFGNSASGNRLTVDFDAAWLGNGCSAATAVGAVIGPAGGTPVCPANGGACVGNILYTGTNTTPLP
jgi:hypothetical protein